MTSFSFWSFEMSEGILINQSFKQIDSFSGEMLNVWPHIGIKSVFESGFLK